MKHIFLIALSLTAHHIIAMDTPDFVKATSGKPAVATQTTNTNAALDEIVTLIDKKINEQYLRPSLLEQFSTTYNTKENYSNIISIPKAIYPAINFNENLLDKLYAKNSLFAQAIKYFVFHAQKNFENVTPANLNTVNDFNAPQPIQCFNELDQSIKKYILQRASNQIQHEYTMKIATGATVIDFDICPKTNTVAISTGDKQIPYRLRLWELKIVAPLHTFEEENAVHFVCFNTPGNQLATLVVQADKSKIKIWNPQSKQLLHTIDPGLEVVPHALAYNDHQENHLLHTTYFIPQEYRFKVEGLLVNQKHLVSCGFLPFTPYDDEKKLHVEKKPYRASHPNNDLLISMKLKAITLDITKSNCSDLYLCEQATKKAQTKQSLNLITQSNPFKTATEYEQNIIKTSIEAKIKQLTS